MPQLNKIPDGATPKQKREAVLGAYYALYMEDARKYSLSETVRTQLGLTMEEWVAAGRYLLEKGYIRVYPLFGEEAIEITAAGIDAYESAESTGK